MKLYIEIPGHMKKFLTEQYDFKRKLKDFNYFRVITSIQFTEQDYMIHIQTMEAQFSQNGQMGDDRWTPLENFDYDEATEQYYIVHRNGTHTPLLLGVDYARPEIMNLDDVMAPPGYVVTGVRFRFAGDSLEKPKLKAGPIQLQIRVTPFDFIRGKLIDLDKTHWIGSQSSIQRLVSWLSTQYNSFHVY